MTNPDQTGSPLNQRHWTEEEFREGMELSRELNGGVIPTSYERRRIRKAGHNEVPTGWQIEKRGGSMEVYMSLGWPVDDLRASRFGGYSSDQLYKAIVDVIEQEGCLPSNGKLREYSRQNPTFPSTSAFARYGGIVNAMEELGIFAWYYPSKLMEFGQQGITDIRGEEPLDYAVLIRSLNFHRFADAVVYVAKKSTGVEEDTWKTWFDLKDKPKDGGDTIIQTFLVVEKQENTLVIARYFHQTTFSKLFYRLELPINDHPKDGRIYSAQGVIKAQGRDQDDELVEFTSPYYSGRFPSQILELLQISARDLSRATSGRSK